MNVNEHKTSIEKMAKDNPFYSMGYTWQWTCTCGRYDVRLTKREALTAAWDHGQKHGPQTGAVEEVKRDNC